MSNKAHASSHVDWDAWDAPLDATLLFVVRRGRILLIEKKRGLGAGKINGPGGKVDHGERPLEAAVREFSEELLATPVGVSKCGEIWFHDIEGPVIRIHAFRATGCDGEPLETGEAVPLWFDLDQVPFDRMWADDRHWFPYLLGQQPFIARTVFAGDDLLEWSIEALPAVHRWADPSAT